MGEHTWVAVVAALLALASRLPFLAQRLHDHDSVNFAHALSDFDLSRHSPHLPGYPLYVLLGRLAHALGASDAAALTWPAVLGAVLASAALALWLAKSLGPALALAGSALYLCLPDLWLADARPLSDGLGAHLVTVTLVLAISSRQAASLAQQRWLARTAVLAAAALLAVRLSSWPIALGAVAWLVAADADPRERRLRLGLLGGATLAWLIPLTWLAGGPVALAQLALAFAQGHAGQWRGEGAAPAAWEQAQLWLQHLWSGGGLLLAGALAAAGAAWRNNPLLARGAVGATAALAGSYALWMVLGQNPDRPRHILPLLVLLTVALLALAAAQRQRLVRLRPGLLLGFSALILAACLAVGLPRLTTQRALPSPDMAMGAWLAGQPAEGLLVLGGSEVGVLRWQAPAVRSLRVASSADLAALLRDPSARAPRLYASSRVGGLDSAQAAGMERSVVATFAARPGVDLAQQTLTLYRLQLPKGLALSPSRSEEHP